jgi:hypothetical protein
MQTVEGRHAAGLQDGASMPYSEGRPETGFGIGPIGILSHFADLLPALLCLQVAAARWPVHIPHWQP